MLTKFEIEFLKRCQEAELVVRRPDISCRITITRKVNHMYASPVWSTVQQGTEGRSESVAKEITQLLAN